MTEDSEKLFGLLVNMRAGKVRSKRYKREFFEELFGDEGIIFEMQSLEEIPKVLKDCSKRVELLFVFGGDGTYQKIFTEMMNLGLSFPYVIPLKGGTVNMLVKDLHLGYSYKKVARRFVEKYRQENLQKKKLQEGNLQEVELQKTQKPVLRISADNWEQPICGFYLSNGSLYRIIRQYREYPASFYNVLKIFWQSLFDSFSRNPHLIYDTGLKMSLENQSCNGEVNSELNSEMQGQFLGIMASVLHRVLFGLRPFVEEERNSKKKQFYFVAYDFERKKLLLYVFLALLGRIHKSIERHSFSISRVVLERLEKLETNKETNEAINEENFVLDGELYSYKGKLRVEVSSDFVLNVPSFSKDLVSK